MRAKCPKCGNVFEVKPGLTLVHVGPYRRIKCPACGKKSMMNNFVKDPITWPPEERENKEESLTDEELMNKRIDESKYEDTEK
jgi:ribosomal protein S27AE